MRLDDSPSHEFLEFVREAASIGRLDLMSLAFERGQNLPGASRYARGCVPAILVNYYFPNRTDLDYSKFRWWSSCSSQWSTMADGLKRHVSSYPRFLGHVERVVELANSYQRK